MMAGLEHPEADRTGKADTHEVVQTVIDSLPTLYFMVDAEGRITRWNAKSIEVSGYSAAELGRMNVLDLFDEEGKRHIAERMRRVFEQGEGDSQAELITKGGRRIPYYFSGKRIHVDGRAYLSGLGIDVSEREAENALANEIILHQTRRPGLDDPRVHHWLMPTADFSGDLITVAPTSDGGKLYALLADATGHGLGAAVSVLPILSVFHNLVGQRLSLDYLISEINRELRDTIPLGRFVAAAVLCIDWRSRTAEIWSGGMPPILHIGADGKIRQRFKSANLPLGIVDYGEGMSSIVRIKWKPGERFACFSDGLIDAAAPDEEPFGLDRVEAAIKGRRDGSCLESLKGEFHRHVGENRPHDDVSFLMIDCGQANN